MKTAETGKSKRKTIIVIGVAVALGCVLYGYLFYRKAAEMGTMRMEGCMKGHLSTVRYALKDYYDRTGRFPDNLEVLAAAGATNYLQLRGRDGVFEIPTAWPGTADGLPARPPHKYSNEVVYYPRLEYHDTGKWAYVTAGPDKGSFFMDCTHTDTKGTTHWTQF